MMALSDVKEWILVASGVVALLSVAISSCLALLEYRSKLRSAKAETDVRLVRAFTELMDIANGRGGYVVSEKLIEELFKRKFVDADFSDLESMKVKIGEFPVICLPVGNASQDSAIAAISTLANRHDVLKEPAKQALETAKSFRKELAEKYLAKISDT
jgi:hypothetical protein